MTKEELISILYQKIEKELALLINSDYVLWDLPYHQNIGDLLIWAGEEKFLSKLPYKCLSRSSCETCKFEDIDKSTIIILHGGGNFGDLYYHHQEFRKSVIKKYSNNRIVIMPQSIFFNNWEIFRKEIDFYLNHKDLHIFTRDKFSYRIAKVFGLKNVKLIPDMAFCLGSLVPSIRPTKNKILIERIDKEKLKLPEEIKQVKFDVIQDWPTYSKTNDVVNSFFRMKGNANDKNVIDIYAYNELLPYLMKLGIDFLSEYKTIYSTRLHACILSILLGKEIYVLNNSYNKNINFYHTWLKGVDGVYCKCHFSYLRNMNTNLVKSVLKSFMIRFSHHF